MPPYRTITSNEEPIFLSNLQQFSPNITTQNLTNIPKIFGESWTNKQALVQKKNLSILYKT
ncbi:hypothetical protein MAN88_03590 [Microcystis aeruginosa]|nr:hypothetical protein MAN88_03590 [Microcystis aeruginosa]